MNILRVRPAPSRATRPPVARRIPPIVTLILSGSLGACSANEFSAGGTGGETGTEDSGTSGGGAGNGGSKPGGAGGAPGGTGGSGGSGGVVTTTGGGPSTGGSNTADSGVGNAPGTGGAAAGAGGVGTGGTPGGTGGAATGGAPALPACRTGELADVLFCDDFESEGLPEWSHLTNAGTDGQTTRVDDPRHGGSWAVKSVKSAPGVLDPLYADVLGNRASDSLFVRVWMFIPSSVTISGNASILVLGEGPPSDGGVSIALWPTGVTLTVYDPNNTTLPYVQTASYQTTLPRDQWFCAQLDFPIGASVVSTDFRLRINGSELVNSEPEKIVDSLLSTPYDRLWLGVNYIGDTQATPVTVYYDDIAVDTTDVACN